MAMADFTMCQLLEAGVHFGHHTRRWNPRIAPFLYGTRNQVYIIDLQQTVPMLDRAVRAVRDDDLWLNGCAPVSVPLPRPTSA